MFSALKQTLCKHKDITKDEKSTMVYEEAFYYQNVRYGTCDKCGKRITVGGSNVYGPRNGWSKEFKTLFREVVQKYDINWDDYGSWWQLEFPSNIARILQQSGCKAAKRYMISTLGFSVEDEESLKEDCEK